jgi:hypothetical protein
MDHAPLSPSTRLRMNILFAPADLNDAELLLVEECGRNLPFCESSTPEGLERVRFGALKLSEGRIDLLCDAIQLAQTDWRDLLMCAGFGYCLDEHLKWMPQKT